MASIVIPENPISWNEQVIYLLNQISISTSGGGTNVNISAFGGTLVTIGQKTMAASMPVVLASDQSLPVGAATSALQGIGNASLASLDADIDVPLSTRLSEASFVGRINTLGQKDMANSTPVVLPNDQLVITKSVPATSGFALPFINNSFRVETTSGVLANNNAVQSINYTIPANYAFSPTYFAATSGTANGFSRVYNYISFGSFDVSTNVFTDGNDYLAVPSKYASRLALKVTTATSALATSVTVTYVNQDGVGGRVTTAAVLSASAPIGAIVDFVLQAGDYGVRDVTAISDTAAPTGVIQIIGCTDLIRQRQGTTDVNTPVTVDAGSIVISNSAIDGFVGVDFGATAVASTTRNINCNYVLMPTN